MLNTNCQFLYPEIMDVIRLFECEEENFTHVFKAEGDVFINEITAFDKNKFYRNEYKAEGELEYKRYAKRFAKLAFYDFLSEKKGVKLPWGALTGIRPTKMAYAELEKGRSFESLFARFGVSAENIRLIQRVIKAQSAVYCKNSGKGEDIYISVPFCPTKCEYCSFITAPVSAVGRYIEDYLDCLVKEIKSLAPLISRVNSVYIGGGTPFCLSAPQLERIYTAINALGISGAEFTVEAGRPDTFDMEKLALSSDMGVNRLCVNPQTFNDKTLALIGRKHTAEDTIRAYEQARAFSFDINLDLIAGLSGESVQDFIRSVDIAAKLSPENITVHTLCLKAGSRLKESLSRLSGDGADKMISYSREALTESGYEPYYLYRQKYQAGANENTGWTKKGKACAYNIDTMEEICSDIAVGANAISKRVFKEGRIMRSASPKDIATYISSCDEIIARRNLLFGINN